MVVGSQDTNLIAALAVGSDGSLRLLGKPATHRGVVSPTSIRFVGGGDTEHQPRANLTNTATTKRFAKAEE